MKLHPILGSVKNGVISGLFGGEEDPKTKPAVFKTQAEVDQANALAKRFSKERGLFAGENAYVARKPGDAKPKFIDSKTGKEFVPSPTKPLRTTLPFGVGLSDIKSGNGAYWYEDPQTGDVVDIDPGVVLSKFGSKSKEEINADLIKRGLFKVK